MAATTVVIAIGSPRAAGNSAALALRAADGVREAGGTAAILRLHEMAIRPCRACDACQRNKNYRCLQVDDMTAVYPVLQEAAGLLIASPVYWFTMSAQAKLFVDRLYAFVGPEAHGLAGKRLGIIMPYGDVDPFSSGAVNALRTWQDAARYTGAQLVGMVYGSASEPGDAARNDDLMREAHDLGRKLATG